VEVPEPIREDVETLNRELFGVDTVAVSVHPAAGAALTEVADAGIGAAIAPRAVRVGPDRVASTGPFLRFRSSAARP
jgi:hypothetical protein